MKPSLFEAQLRRLARKHPHLENLRWRHCALAEAPLADICSLITTAWRRAYGDRITIAFSPALFRLAMSTSGGQGIVTLAEDDTGLCGVIVGLPVDYRLDPGSGPVTLTTGLCASEQWEGSGIIEMLLARHSAHLLSIGHAFSLHWRAGSSDQKGRQPVRLFLAGKVGLYVKPLILEKAVRLGKLPWWQAVGLRVLTLRHRSGKALPASSAFRLEEGENMDEIAEFLNKYQPANELARLYTGEYLRNRAVFNEEGIRGVVISFRETGHLSGVLWGYTNPVNGLDAYFAVDGAVFHPDLPVSSVKHYLSAAEGYIRDTLGCFAMMTPGSVCRIPLEKMGYFMAKRYLVGAAPYNAPAPLTPENVADTFLELR